MSAKNGCFMVTGYLCDEHGDPGDEIECGAPIWLPSEHGGGYCQAHAFETAKEGLDCFTFADRQRYLTLLAGIS